MKVIIGIIACVCIFSLYLNGGTAYGLFDSYDNYHCDPNVIDLEKINYEAYVNSVNDALRTYVNNNPNATVNDIHNYIINGVGLNGHNVLDTINKTKSCLVKNNVNPDSIATLSPEVQNVLSIPEFVQITGLIMAISIMTVIVFSCRSRLHF